MKWLCYVTVGSLSVVSLIGCASVDLARQYEYWADLYPVRDPLRTQQAEVQLQAACSDVSSRDELLSKLKVTLLESRLSFKDQYVSALVMSSLLASLDNHDSVLSFLRQEQCNTDFLGMLFFSRRMYSPEYFEFACDALRKYGSVPVKLLDHDGSVVKQDMNQIISRGLRRATDEDFDCDSAAWLNWWENKGSKLQFDLESMSYVGGKE